MPTRAGSSVHTIALRVLAAALALSSVALRGSAAQAPRMIQLKPADAKLTEEFTSIDYVRELADRRILIVDAREKRLVIADFASGTVGPVSRSGSGPAEFRSISGLFGLAGDSTLLVDDENRRWLLLRGTRVVATLPPDAPATVAARQGELGTDRVGHLLAQLNAGRVAGDPLGRLDSPYVALVDRRTGKADTVGRIRAAPRLQVAATYAPDGTLASAKYRFAPFTAFEQVAIFPDGWIAIARLDPYHVEWRSPDGQWIRGAPIPVPPVKVDDQEKRAWLARTFGGQVAPPEASTISSWPGTIPPFEAPRGSIVLAASDGALLVKRSSSARHEETLYDVIDRRGARVGQLPLPKNERIVGFGLRTVFVVVTDSDGIQRLRRHPWP